MKKMNLKSAIAIVSLMFGMFMFQSCTDECKDVTCLNGGVCDEATGDCICATGYEGVECEVEMRTKFIADYNVTDNCEGTYTSAITASSQAINKVLISNILGPDGDRLLAEVNGNNITIPVQTVKNQNNQNWIIRGKSTGTIVNNQFTIVVEFKEEANPANVEDCSLIFSKI